MKKKLLLPALVCVLFLLQIYPLLPLAAEGIRPDFILILTLYCVIHFSPVGGAFLVFLLGCLLEVFSGVNYGLYPLVYLVIFVFIRSLRRFFDFSTPASLFLLAACSLLVKYSMLLFCFSYIYEYRHFELREPFLTEAAYTLIMYPLVFPLLCSLYKTQKDQLAPARRYRTL